MTGSGTIRWVFLAVAAAAAARADLIDRIAVSVGSSVITVSDIDREIRVSAFLNGAQSDFSAASKRATAERMVEQKLIRRELDTNRYPVPAASEVEPVLEAFTKEHYPNSQAFQLALVSYGITVQDVKDELLWQRTLLSFIEVRFRPGVQVSDQDIRSYFENTVEPAARAAHPGEPVALEDYRDQIEQTLAGKLVDQETDRWLSEARRRTEIVYHPEAFQ